MKPVITMQVRAYLIENGIRRLVLERKHNAVGANLIGRICYYLGHDATTTPAAGVGFTYASTEVYEAGSNAAAAVYGSTGYQFVHTATWTNGTGASKTITDLRLLTADPISSSCLEYGTLTGLSQDVGIGAELEVQWTLIMKQNASGGTTIPQAWFATIIEYFRTATATWPVTRLIFYDNNAAYDTVDCGDPISGGTVDSSNVVWQCSATAPAGASTLAEIKIYCEYADSLLLADDQTGFSDSWVAGSILTDTITCTPVTI